VTYDGFADAWPQRDGEFADRFNNMPKYVVGSKADASRWTNTTVLEGDPVEAATRVRDDHRGNIYVHGSRQLAQALFEHDLVDQLNLMVFPLVLGTGKRIFGETTDKKKLRLVDSKVVGDGVAILLYQPAPANNTSAIKSL
jgi:dihydrofolate reductase